MRVALPKQDAEVDVQFIEVGVEFDELEYRFDLLADLIEGEGLHPENECLVRPVAGQQGLLPLQQFRRGTELLH